MVIAIDGYEANVEKRVGIGRYAYEILCGMYRQASDHTRMQFAVYLPGKPKNDMPKETYWWQYRSIGPRRLWTWFGLPLRLSLDRPKADVVFSPTHYIPRFTNVLRVMAIMDLSYLTYPQLFKKKDLHQLVHWTAYAAAHAAGICTISEFSKRAIIEAYNVPPDKVHVTYPGFSMDVSHIDQDIHKKFKIRPSFILSVGTIQPRKNYSVLIEAFAKYLHTTGDKDTDLVIVGKKGWLYEPILKAPKLFGVEERVKFLSFVPDADLPSLYKKALCFALPSLYEGFGLPVLEAMTMECPVVVSNTSSLPEIAGQAGIYVDPLDVDSVARGIGVALEQRQTAEGKKRIELGKKQAKQFTWERAAQQTLDVLNHVGKHR